mmetsp:Transcript_29411/g.91020  ORF Transcript_29411/g.91020 Transcript_29411/m.91020 type:complete len:273 (+) Transcript_29411:973-1791(+)
MVRRRRDVWKSRRRLDRHRRPRGRRRDLRDAPRRRARPRAGRRAGARARRGGVRGHAGGRIRRREARFVGGRGRGGRAGAGEPGRGQKRRGGPVPGTLRGGARVRAAPPRLDGRVADGDADAGGRRLATRRRAVSASGDPRPRLRVGRSRQGADGGDGLVEGARRGRRVRLTGRPRALPVAHGGLARRSGAPGLSPRGPREPAGVPVPRQRVVSRLRRRVRGYGRGQSGRRVGGGVARSARALETRGRAPPISLRLRGAEGAPRRGRAVVSF